MIKRLNFLLATCCGAGLAPVAPGTAGAAVGLVPVFLLNQWPFAYAIAFLLLFFAGVLASTRMEKLFGEKDSSKIVIDEATSIMITFAAIPLSWATVTVGFVLNRFLDIVKPYPADRIQHCNGGWGVMLDDVVAGVYSNILLRVVWALWLRS